METADKTYCISFGDSNKVYLSNSPKEFVHMIDTNYLNTQLITKEDLVTLVGYLAVTYPNVELETIHYATTFLKCVEVPK